MTPISPDPLSLATHQLYLAFGNSILGSATGFTISTADEVYLITNWHNVTGVNPGNMMCLHSGGGIPDNVSTCFRLREQPGRFKRVSIPLYRDADRTVPVWLEHPTHRENVDVVAIPISSHVPADCKLLPFNSFDFSPRFKSQIADDAFVIGYPFFSEPLGHLPVWKRASIGTEPDVDIDNLPKILIDTATRPGLSGSPVIMQRTGVHGIIGGALNKDTVIATIRNFIGVYSGRIGDGELNAQLGIVWKESVISEIIEGQILGVSRF